MMTLMKFADKNFATDINMIKLSQMINKQTFFFFSYIFCVFVRSFENRINRVRGTMTLTWSRLFMFPIKCLFCLYRCLSVCLSLFLFFSHFRPLLINFAEAQIETNRLHIHIKPNFSFFHSLPSDSTWCLKIIEK